MPSTCRRTWPSADMRLARVEVAGQAFWALLDGQTEHLRRINAPFSHWVGLCADLAIDALDLAGQWLPLSAARRSEEHTSELQSLMRISYAVFCLTKKTYVQSI